MKQDHLDKLRDAGDEWFIDNLISIAVCAEIKLREGHSTDTGTCICAYIYRCVFDDDTL